MRGEGESSAAGQLVQRRRERHAAHALQAMARGEVHGVGRGLPGTEELHGGGGGAS